MADILYAENPATTSDIDIKFYEKYYEGSVVNQKQSQSFLVTPTTISLSKVSLKISVSSPTSPSGTMRVSIYAADVNHRPTGSVLGYAEISASTTGNAWRDFIFSPPLSLAPALYSLVITAENIPLPPSPNLYGFYIGWTYLTDRYTSGKLQKWNGTWTTDGEATDLMFKVYKAQVYTVSYDGNGNTGGSVPSSVSVSGGGSTVVSSNGSLVKTDYTFTGWNTAANGSGTSYAVSSTLSNVVADTVLYAQWAQTTFSGVATISNVGGNITLVGDTVITATGDVTLDIAEVSNFTGSNSITVQSGGKLKLTNGYQITVNPNTLYRLLP